MTNEIIDQDLIFEGKPIEFVSEFVYLGSCLSFDGGQEKEISRRTQNGWKAFWRLKTYLTTRRISLQLRLKLFNMCVLPVLTYSCGTWTTTKRTLKKIDVTHLAMLRRILGVTRRDRIRNEKILEDTDARPLSEIIHERRWKWAGHVARREDGRWTEAVTTWWPRENGKRRRGAQKKRWKDDLKKRSVTWWHDARARRRMPPLPEKGRPVPRHGCTSRPS